MTDEPNLVEMTIEIVSSYVAHNNLRPQDLPDFIAATHAAVAALAEPGPGDAPAPATQYEPAVSVRKSLASRDHIVSMIDGKSYRSLKRHLTANGLTPEDYRQRYGLRADYPMVAPGYSEARREVAHRLGLGRKPRTAVPDAEDVDTTETVDNADARAPRKPRAKKADTTAS